MKARIGQAGIPAMTDLVAALGFAGVLVYRGIVLQQNQRQLQSLTDQTLRRSEMAVDLVVMKISELIDGALRDN